MTTTTSVIHPSVLPTLFLISLLSTPHSELLAQPLDQLLELSLTTIYENTHPPSLTQWLHRILQLDPKVESGKTANLIQDKMMKLLEGGLDEVQGWFNDLKIYFPSSEDDDSPINPTRLHRASPFALYIRKCRLAFAKMAFDEAVAWWDSVNAWCHVGVSPADPGERKSRREKMGDLYRKGRSYQDYQAEIDASSFHDLEEGGSGASNLNKTHYALLNSAFLEYEMGGLESSRQALKEAVQVARRLGDSRCLSACSSLSKRLDFAFLEQEKSEAMDTPTSSGANSHGFQIGEGRQNPTDVLWDIKKLTALGHPPATLLGLLFSSRAMYQNPMLNSTSTEQGRITNWSDRGWEAGWFASSALLWDQLGSKTLTDIKEKIALDSIDVHIVAWTTKLPILARRANRLATNHRSADALQMLLRAVDSSKKRRGMGVSELRMWERAVLDVCFVRAKELGLKSLADHIRTVSPPPAPHCSVDGVMPCNKDGQDATAEYDFGCTLFAQGQIIPALPHLLQSLRLSTLNFLQPLRTKSLLKVIECRIAVSATPPEANRGLNELQSEWSEILGCGKEIEADSRILRAKLRLIKGGQPDLVLEDLNEAKTIFQEFKLGPNVQKVLLLLARVYDNLSRSDPSWIDHRARATREYMMEKGRIAESEEAEWKRLGEVADVMRGVEGAVLAGLAVTS